MSYIERQIDFTIKLADGTFDGTNDSVTLTGLRSSVELTATGGESLPMLNCRIYGLPLSMMNQLTRVGPINTVNGFNSISVSAGNVGFPLSLAFTGIIYQAFADMQAQPDAALNIMALPVADLFVTAGVSSSFPGAVDVSDICAGFAKAMGLDFESNGVSVILNNVNVSGSLITQLKAVVEAAGIYFTVERGVLAIWPSDGYRSTEVPVISPASGMVGYPVYSSMGMTVTSEFIPSANLGGQVKVESSLTPASGLWNIFSVIHQLESQSPNGAWFTQITGYPA